MASPLKSVRARSTLAATLVVASALILAGFAAVTLQRLALLDAIDAALVARVDDVSALIVGGAVPSQLAVQNDDDAVVQIVDSSGTVIASSGNISGEGPIADDHPSPGTRVVVSRRLPVGEGDFRLVAQTVQAADLDYTVYAASSQERASEAVSTLVGILLVGVPLLILFVGVTVWVIVGRTLHPVEAIRGQVASIGDRELDRRVPVPDTDDEIGRLAVTMNEMLGRLERSAADQRRFVADASHELRSPLSTIRSQLEVNQAHPDRTDWSESNADVLAETLRMQRLVEDLLILARGDGATRSALRQPVDLDDIVFAQVDRQAGSGASFDTSSVSGAQVPGDADALDRLVRNLLENAGRYAKATVNIRLSEMNGDAVLVVEDDGPGIPVADREKVFDRFTRLDEARDREHGGSGLGLAISKEIVRQHAGTIELGDSPSGGARISVVLPLGR